jgi:hypothetical protein
LRAHRSRTGEAVPVGGTEEALVAGDTAVEGEGVSVSGSVARPCAAAPLGRKSGPFWPQAESSTADAAAASIRRRAGVLTRIWRTPNIWKL